MLRWVDHSRPNLLVLPALSSATGEEGDCSSLERYDSLPGIVRVDVCLVSGMDAAREIHGEVYVKKGTTRFLSPFFFHSLFRNFCFIE